MHKIMIEGVTIEGKPFRPSDWAERLCGALSTFENNRIHYSHLLHPSVKNGERCVLMDPTLETSNPKLYKEVMDFAFENHLKICNK